MSTSVYVGLAVTSHDESNLCSATFTNVSVTQNTLKSTMLTGAQQQLSEEMNFKAYGKKNTLVLSLSSETLQDSRLMVYDLMGRKVMDTRIESVYNEYLMTNNGVFIVKVICKEGLQYQSKVWIR